MTDKVEDVKSVKEAIGKIGSAFEEFKSANDERIKQIEEKGNADPILVEKVDKLSAAIGDLDSMKARLEKAETAAARKNKGEIPDDADEKAMKWAESRAKARGVQVEGDFSADDLKVYRAAFTEYMRKGRTAEEIHAKALSVGSDPDGGYTVEPDTNGRIVTKVFETSAMRQYAAQQTIGTDALEGMFDLEEAGSGWVGETQSRPETNTPKLAKWRIPVHELYAFPFATQKLLDDSEVNIEAWLAGKVADKFARDENTAFVNGNGTGKPRGFLTYSDGTTLPGTIQQFKTGVNGAFAANPAGGDVLLNAIYGMKAPYRSNARFFMNRNVLSTVRKLKNSDGDYMWAPGLAAGQPSSLLGYGIGEFEDMPNLGTGSLSIAFANFAEGYQIVDRVGIRVLRDPYTNKPYIGFYTTKRVGGDVINFEAIKLINFAS